MASNLRDRLKRIQDQIRVEKPKETNVSFDIPILKNNGWEECGFQVLKKEILLNTQYKLNRIVPESIGIVVPDLAKINFLKNEDFLFFDLETTGLSGGAGTVAFLAAFGRFAAENALSNALIKLHITQYLLLDYPGENNFLEAVLKEFKNENSVIVTYNGKCFDSQILKTRCLMNGIKPPEYYHADLLHPARRLWKNVIQDCSQASVEAGILGLDRGGDIPGALAPEIWFEFLKTGKTERLLGICCHNSFDITGLSSILAAMISIAEDPFSEKYDYDIERIALYWRDFIHRHNKTGVKEYYNLQKTGNELLLFAADKKYPRAAYMYAYDQMRSGNYGEGRKRLLGIVKSSFPENIKAAALRSLSIDSERRLKDAGEALEFVRRGLEFQSTAAVWQAEFERRAQRLEKKLKANR